ncbi:MAG: hypothetical protein HC886_07875 [Leptolyngbyaceae cyanobacterium SM1_1_3]|nr:hypothetical protein [Leptolyngbyaceae cyanobacterium SM1_1_3]NJN01221.1 hypothetical protein [Leptolyngbyaceae cyanobacterium RM1_1_2]NJO09063.1 hypothetical protein [Leptolyngbyaceae cyanobacterium SL_1_1]
MTDLSIGQQLEQYTLKRPTEVLRVRAEIAGEEDEVMIFRGFSSSLMRPTAFDPDVPVLPQDAKIVEIDRLRGPYIPTDPQYIAQGLTWAEFETLMAEVGL